MAVLHGVPTGGHDLDALEKLYWGLNTHLGTGVTQNSEAGLLHYVTDGKLRPRQGTRGVGNPGKVNLHVDLADCVGLFCVRQAPDDPHSHVASSMTVYNELLRHHPPSGCRGCTAGSCGTAPRRRRPARPRCPSTWCRHSAWRRAG